MAQCKYLRRPLESFQVLFQSEDNTAVRAHCLEQAIPVEKTIVERRYFSFCCGDKLPIQIDNLVHLAAPVPDCGAVSQEIEQEVMACRG